MLNFKKILEKTKILVSLLLFISLIFIHTNGFAVSKKKLAEEYRLKGYAKQQKGDLYAALAQYSKAIALGLENAVVLNDMGVLYEQVNLQVKAEQYYLKAIQVDNKYLSSYMNLAYLYEAVGNKEKAFGYFKKRYELGDPDDAWTQKAKEELLKIYPESIQWIVNREGDRLSQELVTRAHEEFYKDIKASAEHYKRGEFFFKKENYTQAIWEFDKALSLTPRMPKIIQKKEAAEFELGKRDVKRRTDDALRMLESGDSISAKREIQKVLAIIPEKPVLVFK